MEVLSSILGGAVAESVKELCVSAISKIKSIVQFQSSLNALEKETKKLIDLRNDIKGQLELAGKKEESPTMVVKNWLAGVEKYLVTEKRLVRASMAGADIVDDEESRIGGNCCRSRCSRRIRLSNKVRKLLKEVETLIKTGSFPDGMVSVNNSAKPVEYIPGPPIEYQKTASKNLAQLMRILDNDNIKRIGVWGMGGVGKTTLVRELNNKLSSSTCSNPAFSIVIWATVSKDLDMKRVQKQVAERLDLKGLMEDSAERMASRLHQRLLKEKFLLILDDVWESIDLNCLGISESLFLNGSKVILTSRLFDVCAQMMTDVELKVDTLSDEEAWQLFSQKAGEITSLEHIETIAKDVARECSGLPLALITVGTAMRRKTKVELWEHALTELRRSVPCIRGVMDKVYNPLKWSYDSLEGNNIKSCFLYCALYPEDFSIEEGELVGCWLAEGLLTERENFEESVSVNGVVIIETLKGCCLLEDGAREGTVKMHDVVRDVAIWIASSLGDGCKSLVYSGMGLNEISELDSSNSLKRVSFMNNKINKLPDCEMECPNTSTLLLQGNTQLEHVPERFLQGFKALRVLNVGGTRVLSLPPSLLQLHELRAILLANCGLLTVLPPLGALGRLQVLDLRATGIRELPEEMRNLINLRQVNLSRTHYLTKIQAGIMSSWTALEVLDMSFSAYHWGTKREVEEGQTSLEELGCLKRLVYLSIKWKRIPHLGSDEYMISFMSRLKRFQFFIGDVATNLFPTRNDERMVVLSRLDLSGEGFFWLLINASSLALNGCWGVGEMIQNLVVYSTRNCVNINRVAGFMALKSLTITSNNCNVRFSGNCISPHELLPNLEEIHLHGLHELTSISSLLGPLRLSFSKLKLIEVIKCERMEFLLLCGNFVLSLPNLETIKVSKCRCLKNLFTNTSKETLGVSSIVPKLRTLELRDLDGLESLCQQGKYSWPSLEEIYVDDCKSLRTLPLTIQNANTIKEIRGEPYWWDNLDCAGKSALQHYFKPTFYTEWQKDFDLTGWEYKYRSN